MAPTAGALPRRGRGRPGRPAARRRSARRPCDARAETPRRPRAPRRAPGARCAGAGRAGAPRGPPTGWPPARARARARRPSTSPPPAPGAPARPRTRGRPCPRPLRARSSGERWPRPRRPRAPGRERRTRRAPRRRRSTRSRPPRGRGRGGRGREGARSLKVARPRRARQRPAPREAVLDPMPEGDLGLPELPAEVDDLAVQLRGEVDQAELHVLQVRAARLDLRDDPVELLHQGAGRGPLPHELLRREARELHARLARQGGQLLVQPERTALQALHQAVETRHDRIRFLEAERFLRSHAKRDATGFAPECRGRAPPGHADPLVRPPPPGLDSTRVSSRARTWSWFADNAGPSPAAR